jgi:hypothetical protein
MRDRKWLFFGAWAVEGALFAFTVLSAASIGLFLVPVVLLGLWYLARNVGMGREAVGAISGFGVPTLVVAILAAGPNGLDARPWLVAGLLLVAAGIAGYLALTRRAQPPSTVV